MKEPEYKEAEDKDKYTEAAQKEGEEAADKDSKAVVPVEDKPKEDDPQAVVSTAAVAALAAAAVKAKVQHSTAML